MAKYKELYEALQNDIDSGKLEVGTKLPSEIDLMETYQVSRDTIRKALDLLVLNGYIFKVHGKGSFVMERSRFNFPVAGLSSFKELSEGMQFKDAKTHVTELSLVMSMEKLREIFNVGEHEKVWRVHRVREINGSRVILDKDYFLESVVKKLTLEICEGSIYEYIEKELGLSIGAARKEIIIEWATDQDRKSLDMGEYVMVAVVNSYVYLTDGTLFQYHQSRHRPDKFRFVDLARRVIH